LLSLRKQQASLDEQEFGGLTGTRLFDYHLWRALMMMMMMMMTMMMVMAMMQGRHSGWRVHGSG
jgi:hypothetical protein